MVDYRPDWSTVDWCTSRIRLRHDCVFIPQPYHGSTFYHVEIPKTSSFYRIGYPEYVFASLLDGETTFAEALTITSQKLGPSALTQAEAMHVYSWLIENQLAQFVDEKVGGGTRSASRRPRHPLHRLNPFYAKIPLCHPDRWLASMLPALGWLFSLPSVIAAIVLYGAALITVGTQWDRFVGTSHIVFSPSNWFWMLVCWLALKVVHELGHGIACKRYGGDVREMGLIFILFAPMAYVDVTSSWRFSSKWQRIHVALAGIYVELIMAALAILVWSRTESELLAHLLYNVVFMASVSTIVFNINPLMRFDGYYILADLLEIPNLYTESQQFVRSWISRLFYGTSVRRPIRAGKLSCVIGLYGTATTIWMAIVSVSIILAASSMFRGGGIVVAAMGAFCWFGSPLLKATREMVRRYHESSGTFYRAGMVSLAMACLGYCGYRWCPNPLAVTAPGIVDFKDLVIVRSATAGFIDQVHVADGQEVKSGDPVITLRNEVVTNETFDLLHQIDQSRIRQRIAIERGDATLGQVEQRTQVALKQRLAVSRRHYEALSVHATISGRIVARGIQQLIGKHVDQGEELLAIGDESAKELVISIADGDIDDVLPHLGSDVKVRVGSRQAVLGKLMRIEPRASTELPHQALAATEGGTLAVKERMDSTHHDTKNLELTEPRYRAFVQLPATISQSLFCGERCYASIGWHRDSIGAMATKFIERWIQGKLRIADE